MLITFNESAFRCVAATQASVNATPPLVSEMARLDPDLQWDVRSLYTKVITAADAAGHQLFDLGGDSAPGRHSVHVWVESAFDGDGIFDGLVFDAHIAWPAGDCTQRLRFTSSAEHVTVDDLGGGRAHTIIDQLVTYINRGVESINAEIRRAEQAWSAVLAA